MPVYDYRCEANGEIYEVRHPMAIKLHTWADLCDVGGFEPGDVTADTPVTRVLTTGGVVSNKTLKNPEAPPCMSGGGCPGRSNCGI